MKSCLNRKNFFVVLVLMALVGLVAETAVADPNLVGWWKFDEGSGTIAYDSAGGNDGTIYGAVWTTGQIDGALSFDGIDDYVDIGDPFDGSLDFGISTDFTLSLWFKTSATGSGMIINKRAKGKQPGYDLYIQAGKICARISDNSSTVYAANTTETFNDDSWYHLAAVYDKDDVITIYVDGSIKGTSGGIAGIGNIDTGQVFTIGDRNDPGDHVYFDGTIDDVRIYNKAISAEEILQLYGEGLGGRAFNPGPAGRATNVDPNVILSWSPGVYAASHDVYFGTSWGEVNDADTSTTGIYRSNQLLDANSYNPPEDLESHTTYYWRIDEANGPNTWKGDVWSFTTSFYEGSGTAEDPYLIYDANDMQAIGADPNYWDKHFKLMADIDLGSFTGTAFNIIGVGGSPFRGTFDGNGYKISNFSYYNPGGRNIGLFGAFAGTVKNLGLISPNVDAATSDFDWVKGENIGALIGQGAGSISGCYVEGGSVSGNLEVGGLVGEFNGGTMFNCYSTCSASGLYSVGGLAGHNEVGGTITNCHFEGSVSGKRNYIGGLVGQNYGMISESYTTGGVLGPDSGDYEGTGGLVGRNASDGTITQCYSTARVSKRHFVGGLVGVNWGQITYCYATGNVSGIWWVGGLVGYNAQGSVTASFWDLNTSGRNSSAGGMGKTTAQMQTESTFISAGWDFTTPIWTIREGVDYPRLWWENTTPVACIVGGDKTVEAGSGCEARVTLDGSCSSDLDSTPGTNDDIVYFDWYEGDTLLGSGEIIDCNLPLGEHDIVLEVTDKAGAFDANEVTITVEDTTPPEFGLAVTPDVLWPANHKMVEITPSWEASDNCDELLEVTLVSITSNEDDDAKGDGHTSDDIQVNDNEIWLRAERSGKRTGRVYTITYQAVDGAGNVVVDSATVTVPHDRR